MTVGAGAAGTETSGHPMLLVGAARTGCRTSSSRRLHGRSIIPRIKPCDATVLHISHVTRDPAEVMLDRCGSQHCVDHQRSVTGLSLHGTADRTPAPHDRTGQRQDPIGEACLQSGNASRDVQPKLTVGGRIVQPFVILTRRQDTEEQGLLVLGFRPRLNACGGVWPG